MPWPRHIPQVMAGLVPAIHDFGRPSGKSWVPAPRAGMTRGGRQAHSRHCERERSNPASGHRSSAMSPNRLCLNHQLGCFAFARNDG